MIQYGNSKLQQNPNNDRQSQTDRGSKTTSRNQPRAAKLKVPQKDLLIFFRQLSVILESPSFNYRSSVCHYLGRNVVSIKTLQMKGDRNGNLKLSAQA